jgi:hypothetical protein
MKNRAGMVIVLLICLPVACGAGYYRFSFRPLNENDYANVAGTLKSIEQAGTYKAPYVEFFTLESPARFRIPSDAYGNSFDQKSFTANVRPGSKVDFKVEKTQLAKVAQPQADPKDTVNVYAMQDNRAKYGTLAGYEKWRERNSFYALVMAILAAAGASVAGLALMKSATAPAPAISENEAALLREKYLSRTYRHLGCGGQTTVSGDDYVMLECPFRPVQRTYCAACSSLVPLKAVEWVDSGENVEAYRKQLYDSVPLKQRLWLSCFGNAYQGAINLGLDKNGVPIRTTMDSPAAGSPV